ncbi:hypothetical protein EVAR_24235_1 [Eumeta japonica]|uniref:Uncharacterized protein n=1 Tax=Eumeta variegata TaxID=151549 RepID=A0A4C1W4Q9_EUMVA|nr:hypothetical protein EVAR_24235_1 [Eumeta japonica]
MGAQRAPRAAAAQLALSAIPHRFGARMNKLSVKCLMYAGEQVILVPSAYELHKMCTLCAACIIENDGEFEELSLTGRSFCWLLVHPQLVGSLSTPNRFWTGDVHVELQLF